MIRTPKIGQEYFACRCLDYSCGHRESAGNILHAVACKISRPWLVVASTDATSLRLSIPGRKTRRRLAYRTCVRYAHLVQGPGIEPGSSDWQPDVLPLNHTRKIHLPHRPPLNNPSSDSRVSSTGAITRKIHLPHRPPLNNPSSDSCVSSTGARPVFVCQGIIQYVPTPRQFFEIISVAEASVAITAEFPESASRSRAALSASFSQAGR